MRWVRIEGVNRPCNGGVDRPCNGGCIFGFCSVTLAHTANGRAADTDPTPPLILPKETDASKTYASKTYATQTHARNNYPDAPVRFAGPSP